MLTVNYVKLTLEEFHHKTMQLERSIMAPLFVFFQVCRMASDYSRTCVSPDSIQTGETPVVSETCEVYVWGSNSSHQLVEGTQEKILQPKLASSFADAQTVRANLSTVKLHMLSKHQFFNSVLCRKLRNLSSASNVKLDVVF